jgi:hypothetical protein
MITIRPTFWRPGNVIWAVVIGGSCVSPVVFQLGAFSELMGLGVLVFMTVLLWLLMGGWPVAHGGRGRVAGSPA